MIIPFPNQNTDIVELPCMFYHCDIESIDYEKRIFSYTESGHHSGYTAGVYVSFEWMVDSIVPTLFIILIMIAHTLSHQPLLSYLPSWVISSAFRIMLQNRRVTRWNFVLFFSFFNVSLLAAKVDILNTYFWLSWEHLYWREFGDINSKEIMSYKCKKCLVAFITVCLIGFLLCKLRDVHTQHLNE